MDRCWYCGTTEAEAYEWEHQLPLSRGGGGEVQVRSCQRCNRFKGPSSLEEYRIRLQAILRHPVTFAGEVGPGEAHTCDMAEVERVMAVQTVVRLSGALSDELRDAYWFLRNRGQYMPVVEIVERGVRKELAELRELHNGGEPFPRHRVGEQLSLLKGLLPGSTPVANW